MTLTDALAETLRAAAEKAAVAGEDPAKLMEAVHAYAELVVEIDNARLTASTAVRELTEKALLAGVDPMDLYNRPFSGTWVREVFNGLREQGHELEPLPRGRRARPRQIPPAIVI